MSNPFFNWTFDVTPGSANRSRPVEMEFAAIGKGFDGVSAQFQSVLRAPTNEQLSLLPNREARRNKSFVFDDNGDPAAAVAATSVEMQAAIAAAVQVNADAAAAAAAAASVATASSYIQQLMLAQGVK